MTTYKEFETNDSKCRTGFPYVLTIFPSLLINAACQLKAVISVAREGVEASRNSIKTQSTKSPGIDTTFSDPV